VLRRRVLRGDLAAADAEALLHFAAPLIDHRHEMVGPLARAAWELRERVSYYDGLYAALAAALSIPLLTADQRLSRASGLGCHVEPVGAR
jgi:predicted nucleic acid-binding protein